MLCALQNLCYDPPSLSLTTTFTSIPTGMLQQLQVAVTALGDKSSQAAASAGVEQVTHKMSELREMMEGNTQTHTHTNTQTMSFEVDVSFCVVCMVIGVFVFVCLFVAVYFTYFSSPSSNPTPPLTVFDAIESCEITTNIVDKLKNSSSNPGMYDIG